MHAARNAVRILLFALVFALGLIAVQPSTDPPLPPRVGSPSPTVYVNIEGERPAPLTLGALTPAPLGWKWQGVVNVYDGTNGSPAWKVAEAAAEWGARTGLQTRMVDKVAAAQIAVYQVDRFTDDGYNNALGLAYWPHVSGGVADGQCRVELISWAAKYKVAEHTTIHEMGHCLGMAHNTTDRRTVMAPSVSLYDGYTRPQAADVRNLKTLYP